MCRIPKRVEAYAPGGAGGGTTVELRHGDTTTAVAIKCYGGLDGQATWTAASRPLMGLADPESVLAHWCAFPAACLAGAHRCFRRTVRPRPATWAISLVAAVVDRAPARAEGTGDARPSTAREDKLHRLLGHTRVPMQVWARGWRARIFGLTRGGDEGEGGDEGGRRFRGNLWSLVDESKS